MTDWLGKIEERNRDYIELVGGCAIGGEPLLLSWFQQRAVLECDIPRLIAEVRRLRARLEKAEAVCEAADAYVEANERVWAGGTLADRDIRGQVWQTMRDALEISRRYVAELAKWEADHAM